MVRQLWFLFFLLLKSATARDRTVMKLQADGSVLECTVTKNGKERCIDPMNPMMVLGNEEHILRQQKKEREKKEEEEMKKEEEMGKEKEKQLDDEEEEAPPPKKGMDLNALLNSPEAKRQIKQALDSGEQVDLSAVVGSTISRAFANLGKPSVVEEEDDDDGPSGVELLMNAALRAAAHASGDPFQSFSNHSQTDQSEFFAKVAKVLSRFNDRDLDMELFLEDLISIATPDHVEGEPIELENIVRTKQKLKDTLQHLLGQLGLQYFHPLQLYYYMIDEETRKNSVWKRHRHRYLPPVPKEEVLQMMDGLYLSQLAYSKNCKTIQRQVEQFQIDPISGNGLWTLRNCSVHSERFQPAHYMMVQQSKSSTPLEVALIIRGSQQQADYLSAGALRAVPYRGGFVHEGVRNSAQWIRDLYENDLELLLQEHRQWNNKVPLKLYLMGHSLGGATASVAAMEFNDVPEFEAFAVGFGSPASLSPDLSRAMKDRITTVVNDADCVPRMSANSIVDAWKRVLQFDFTSLCLDDVNQLEPILRSKLSILGNWTENMLSSMRTTVEDKIRKEAKKQLSNAQKVLANASSDQYESLVPAGDCVHFYRDGTSWQSVYIDCQQFYEIEVVPHMIDDHLVAGGYYHGMLAYLRKLEKNSNFRPLHEVDSLLRV
ncbi:hypothetical protein FisN_22Hh039 [Fistulifera solaris]|uniref:Fungal lipase-type domain-containing protein n=1 Tax=Fistulifera solaris TaxID=1519565 RepID=A0A1Z5K317_FISSO|nr:hypothetical protein FisN_22Hh039 [Fistulifera solaris]|eukprot:GAX20471.1 hypothetical protein FisN_22Hh039 [Fistulifera solaris]